MKHTIYFINKLGFTFLITLLDLQLKHSHCTLKL